VFKVGPMSPGEPIRVSPCTASLEATLMPPGHRLLLGLVGHIPATLDIMPPIRRFCAVRTEMLVPGVLIRACYWCALPRPISIKSASASPAPQMLSLHLAQSNSVTAHVCQDIRPKTSNVNVGYFQRSELSFIFFFFSKLKGFSFSFSFSSQNWCALLRTFQMPSFRPLSLARVPLDLVFLAFLGPQHCNVSSMAYGQPQFRIPVLVSSILSCFFLFQPFDSFNFSTFQLFVSCFFFILFLDRNLCPNLSQPLHLWQFDHFQLLFVLFCWWSG